MKPSIVVYELTRLQSEISCLSPLDCGSFRFSLKSPMISVRELLWWSCFT